MNLIQPINTPSAILSLARIPTAMSDHRESHIPEEAEENEIAAPVIFILICLVMLVLTIWAAS